VVRSGEYARCDGLLQEVEFELWEQRRERKLASVLQRRQPIVLGALSGFARTDRDLLADGNYRGECFRSMLSCRYNLSVHARTWRTHVRSRGQPHLHLVTCSCRLHVRIVLQLVIS
jgi:hypothetical protein